MDLRWEEVRVDVAMEGCGTGSSRVVERVNESRIPSNDLKA